MRRNIIFFIIGMMIGSTLTVVGAGITKTEMGTSDASSMVGYGTSDAGDSIVRIKTEADGTVLINGI